MKKISIALGVISLLAMGAAQAAPDLISTVSSSKSGTTVEIDFVNNGEVSGMQFDIKVPLGSAKTADLGGCLSGLPAAFSMSSCTMTKSGIIRVVVLSPNGAILPTGAIGSITLPNGAQGIKGAGDVSLEGVVMGAADGSPIGADFIK